HNQLPFPDAATNPATNPIHTYHVGLWFGSATDAAAAGCPGTVTPFNGDHTAGGQALSTRNFADDQGPLRQIVGGVAGGVTISPPSGVYATNQTVDLELLVNSQGRTIQTTHAAFDGIDISSLLASCLVPGTLPPNGITLKCAGVPLSVVGP